MTEASTSGGSTRVSRIIKAPRTIVYQAFLDPEAVAAWLAPDTMRSRVHTFDPREGGEFRISLTHQNPEDSSAERHLETQTPIMGGLFNWSLTRSSWR